jgi:hypothetical protein
MVLMSLQARKGSLGKLSNSLCQKDWMDVEVKADDRYDTANEEGDCNDENWGFGICTDNSEYMNVIMIRPC